MNPALGERFELYLCLMDLFPSSMFCNVPPLCHKEASSFVTVVKVHNFDVYDEMRQVKQDSISALMTRSASKLRLRNQDDL